MSNLDNTKSAHAIKNEIMHGCVKNHNQREIYCKNGLIGGKIYFDSKDEYYMWVQKNRRQRSIYDVKTIPDKL